MKFKLSKGAVVSVRRNLHCLLSKDSGNVQLVNSWAIKGRWGRQREIPAFFFFVLLTVANGRAESSMGHKVQHTQCCTWWSSVSRGGAWLCYSLGLPSFPSVKNMKHLLLARIPVSLKVSTSQDMGTVSFSFKCSA